MSADLFLKRVPAVVKQLIEREATENRRSVNQEAIALLEEALLHRLEAHVVRRRTRLEELRQFADSERGALGEPGPAIAPAPLVDLPGGTPPTDSHH